MLLLALPLLLPPPAASARAVAPAAAPEPGGSLAEWLGALQRQLHSVPQWRDQLLGARGVCKAHAGPL